MAGERGARGKRNRAWKAASRDGTGRPRRPWWRRWWAIALALVGLLLVLVLERSPAAERTPPPGVTEVRSARAVYQRVREAQDLPGHQVIQASWEELAAVAAMGGRAALGIDRVNVVPAPDRLQASASVALPAGFWLNGHVTAKPDRDGRPRFSARIGDLPVPAFLVHGAIGAGRWVLRLRGARIEPLDSMLLGLRIEPAGVAAVVNLPSQTGIVRSLSTLVAEPIDAERVEAHYCRLVRLQQAGPDATLLAQVRRGFGAGDGSATDNRALFVALALLVAGLDGNALGESRDGILARCGTVPHEITLQGRTDLAMHWTVSAALAAALGSDVSLSIGVWKEISDSGEGGSGFSLVDLAADRSGVFCAQRGADAGSAAGLREWLLQADEADLLPVSALALAEGMSEQEFRNRYASTESAEFEATVQRIDRQLAILLR